MNQKELPRELQDKHVLALTSAEISTVMAALRAASRHVWRRNAEAEIRVYNLIEQINSQISSR
mgnify:CR=1 FL=1